MTDTTPAAVELLATELPDTQWQAPRLHRAADTLRALSAKLEAANQRAEMLANSLATAQTEGKADGLQLALDCASLALTGDADGRDIYSAILALIPASPAEPAQTVQEAAKVLLDDESTVTDLAIEIVRANRIIDGQRIGVHPALIIALRAIAWGRSMNDQHQAIAASNRNGAAE